MKISVLCTDAEHPVFPFLQSWRAEFIQRGHEVELVNDRGRLSGGDVLFLVSCSQLIPKGIRDRYRATLVLHASDLPKGRGWSPHIWAIVNGATRITVCLLEASEPVDSGAIWLRRSFSLEGHELLPEINAKLFAAELELMSEAVERFGSIEPQPQSGESGDYMPKRTPQDSRLDPTKSLAEQFDLLRVVDSSRYPAFMDYRGKRFVLRIEKDDPHVEP
jgi:methionyl-tRNA formyltransferase